ncbi:Elongation factor P, putative, expressed [Zostera marina]|uniref:Elongation factor P, putative, expressed n=1 Tax=Zostera marina TaxID=29655 RepID=A0A0K9NY76_ZOSMR|nr:Elongation factor P, putative, expressed [Zostera marina]
MEGIVSMNNIVTTNNPRHLHSTSSFFSAFARFPTRVSILPARPSLRSRFTKIYALSSNDIKVGTSIEVDGAPWKILEFLHVKPGKGAAFVRTKMKNFITGSVVDKTFRAGCPVDEADVVKETKQYSYKDGSLYVFMDMTTYEEIRLNEENIGDRNKYLKEGMDCTLLFWNRRVIDFDLPVTVNLTITEVDPGLKGDTAQGGTKRATLDTGVTVNVPLFVNNGDVIIVDTRTGQYVKRA